MAKVDLQLVQVTDAGGGLFNVYVRAVRNGTGEEIKNAQVTVADKAGLKDALRPHYQALINEEKKKAQMEAMAAAALQELMDEFYPA